FMMTVVRRVVMLTSSIGSPLPRKNLLLRTVSPVHEFFFFGVMPLHAAERRVCSRCPFSSYSPQTNLNHDPHVAIGSRVPSTTRRPRATAVWGVRRPYMRRTNVSGSH